MDNSFRLTNDSDDYDRSNDSTGYDFNNDDTMTRTGMIMMKMTMIMMIMIRLTIVIIITIAIMIMIIKVVMIIMTDNIDITEREFLPWAAIFFIFIFHFLLNFRIFVLNLD